MSTTVYYSIRYYHRKLKIGSNSRLTKSNFGKYCSIGSSCVISRSSIDDYTYTADNVTICRCKIGKFCSIGPGVKIALGQHPTSKFISTHPIFYSKQKPSQITFSDKNYFKEEKAVTIGNDVWIGTNALILDGVKIGNGAIIAANAVVTKDVSAYSIVGGVPAKLIRHRFSKKDIRFIQKTKWWDKDQPFLAKHFKSFHNMTSFKKLFSSN